LAKQVQMSINIQAWSHIRSC